MFATSRDVAAYFEKDHRNVLQSIDALVAEGVLNYQQTPYVNAQNGQAYRCFEMDRDGFTLLAMGFTGPKALKFKLAYIDTDPSLSVNFNRIEIDTLVGYGWRKFPAYEMDRKGFTMLAFGPQARRGDVVMRTTSEKLSRMVVTPHKEGVTHPSPLGPA